MLPSNASPELYTRAFDQLCAEKAPVRLGGLHALERLAQNNPPQRQTIVAATCAYLRMPYTLPDDQALARTSPRKRIAVKSNAAKNYKSD